MRNFLILIVLIFSNFVVAQNPTEYDLIDKKMDEIPSNMESTTSSIASYIETNFTSTEDKIRAAFYWTASNISYDVENMLNQKPNQTPQEKITSTLKSKKGVCMHYSELFKDITNKMGVTTILINGYTKTNGKIAALSHVWCASKINEIWYLFDPTWGAGYIENQKYIKKLNNNYFKAEPKSLISSHMPFDYLWQFSEYPISNQDFHDNKELASNTDVKFDFRKEIAINENRTDSEKATACAYRIEKNGIKNRLISERLDFEKKQINYANQKDSYAKTQQIIASFNQANALFKDFIMYRNSKFIPLVSDDELKNKIQVPYDLVVNCEKDINEVKDVQKENISNMNSLKKAIADSKKNFEIHLNFVNDYLLKDKVEREKMFTKRIGNQH